MDHVCMQTQKKIHLIYREKYTTRKYTYHVPGHRYQRLAILVVSQVARRQPIARDDSTLNRLNEPNEISVSQGQGCRRLLLLCVYHGCGPRVHANSKENTFVKRKQIYCSTAHTYFGLLRSKNTNAKICGRMRSVCLGSNEMSTTLTCCFGVCQEPWP